MSIELGRIGIWRHASGLTAQVVAEIEALAAGPAGARRLPAPPAGVTRAVGPSAGVTRAVGPSAGIGALALTDLLGHWPAADGPLYRLLATRIARLADTGEPPAGLRLPAERDLAKAVSVSRNAVAAAYQLLRDEGMAESRQGAGTRIVAHRITPAAVHQANGFFTGLPETSVVDADLSLAAVEAAPQVAAAMADPETVLDRAGRAQARGGRGAWPPAQRQRRARHPGELIGPPGLHPAAGRAQGRRRQAGRYTSAVPMSPFLVTRAAS
jgi:Bacterial regulatory proteins, gntR family